MNILLFVALLYNFNGRTSDEEKTIDWHFTSFRSWSYFFD